MTPSLEVGPSLDHLEFPAGPPADNPVQQYPSSGIEILVIGGSTAGLYFALECMRQGHRPVIVESKLENAQPDGDFFVLGDSATGNIKYWPTFKKAFDDAAQDTWNKYYRHDGTPLVGPFPNPTRIGKIIIRKQFQEMMMAEIRRLKVPIFFGDKVVEYFETETKGGVILQSGRKLEADLVAACDGVHSRSWKLVLEQRTEAFPTGLSILRCSMPTKQALRNEKTREKFDRKVGSDGKLHDTLEFLIGPDIHANMTVAKDVTCWLCVYKDDKTEPTNANESWANTVSPDEAINILNRVPGWDPIFFEMVKASPPIVDWRLIMRNPQPKWVSEHGRVVQVGDAAHPFLPTSVNGATQAMEDAVSLAACLRLSGAGRKGIPMACRVHNSLRFERTACSQLGGLLNRERLHKTDWKKLNENQGELQKIGPGGWIAIHDPEQYAIDNYQKCEESLQPGAKTIFVNTNIPPGYVYEPWDARKIFKDAAQGKRLEVKGDWR